MQVCFIPPRGMEMHIAHGDMVMALAHLVDRLDYGSTYTDAINRAGKRRYTILDNGMCEGEELVPSQLFAATNEVKTSELVLPDRLGDADGTWKVASYYLSNYSVSAINYMGVVQGSSEYELKCMISKYADEPSVKTVGLPRLLLGKLGINSIRINLANWVETAFPDRFDIHFLGASTLWVKEAYYAAKYASHVRSIDTSLPYNYGFEGISINAEVIRPVERRADYFTGPHYLSARTTFRHNESVYRDWCHGRS